jgi:hypothetical protein
VLLPRLNTVSIVFKVSHLIIVSLATKLLVGTGLDRYPVPTNIPPINTLKSPSGFNTTFERNSINDSSYDVITFDKNGDYVKKENVADFDTSFFRDMKVIKKV